MAVETADYIALSKQYDMVLAERDRLILALVQISNEMMQHRERLRRIAEDGAMDDYQAGQGLAYTNAHMIVRRIGGLDG